MLYLVIIFLSFLFVIFSTPRFIKYSIKKGLVDTPSARKIHEHPIPRMGGIVIFAVVWIIMVAFYLDFSSKIFFMSGTIFIVVLGLIDDFINLNWKIKFGVQAIVSVLLMIFIFRHYNSQIIFGVFELPSLIGITVLFFFIVGTINAFNLLDGLDGLVAGQTLIIATLCLVMSITSDFLLLPILAASLVGSMVGFLKFNAHPARIFLGDTGSLLLGYLIVVLLLAVSAEVNNQFIDLVFAIIVLSVPIIDTLRVVYIRLSARNNPFLADKNHIHHLILNRKIRHKSTVLIIHGFALLFALNGIIYLYVSKIYGLSIYAIILPSFIFAGQLLDLIIRKENLLFYGRLVRATFPNSITKMYVKIVIPIVVLVFCFLLGFLIVNEVIEHKKLYTFFGVFVLLTIVYAIYDLRTRAFIADVIVLLNFLLFFILTGMNGTFYKLYTIPLVGQLNINQMFIIILLPVIIVFVLMKERILNRSFIFFTGIDLVISVVITFVFIALKLIEIPESYLISDILVRGFMLYLLYKIVVNCYPKSHVSLYFSTFAVTIIVLLKSIIL